MVGLEYIEMAEFRVNRIGDRTRALTAGGIMGEEETLLRPQEAPKSGDAPPLGNPPGDLIHDAFGDPDQAVEDLRGILDAARAKADDKPVDKPVEAPAAARPAADAAPAADVRPFTPLDAAAKTREIEELRRTGAPLTGDDLKRNQYLQQTLSNLAGLFSEHAPKRDDETNEAYMKRVQDELSRQRERLDLEKEAGVFGPATKSAYESYVNFLQKRAIPEAVREMDSLQLAMPPGCPITLPSDQYQRSISPELYRAMSSNSELSLNMGLDITRLPTEEQLQKLDGAFNWLAKCNEGAAEARGQHQERVLNKLIGDMGLPQSWKRREGEDAVAWRASAAEMVDLATRTRNYIEAMQSLYKTSHDRDFPLELPLGARVVVQVGDQRHEVGAKDLNDPTVRGWLKTGSIREVRLDLPQDLRQDNPINDQKIQNLREWITRHGDKIDQAVHELVKANPQSILMYGDQEVKNGRAILNDKGEFIGLAAPDYVAKPGETLKDTNLIGHDFEVEDLGNGKFKISQTVQAEIAPWYAYQNFRCLGIDPVGKKMPIASREVDGDAFIPVRNGDKIEIVQAKNLAQFRAGQESSYKGEKFLSTAVDVAFAASVVVTAGATTGAMLGYGALQLTARQAAWQLGKLAIRATVAGAGILNNAGGRDLSIGGTNVGEAINTARGLYFLADISHGLASGGWKLFRAAKATEALSGAEIVETVIHGRAAANGAEAIKAMPFISQLDKATTFAFKASEFAFAPVIVSELSHLAQRFRELGERDPGRDAVIQVGDGRGLQRAQAGAFNPQDQKAVDGAREVLDNYASTLVAGRTDAVKTEVQAIFDEAKRLIGKDVRREDRAAFLQRMLDKSSFTGEEIEALEKLHDSMDPTFVLTNERLRDLLDPVKRLTFPRKVQDLAESILASKNPDVMAASRIAMLYAGRDADGKLPESLSSASRQIRAYSRVTGYDSESGAPITTMMPARTSTVSMSPAEAVRDLRSDMMSKDLGNRGIVTGDVLTRVGALTHQQYAGLLQDVLRNPAASREDKMRALTDPNGARFSTILDGTRYVEFEAGKEQSAVERQRAVGRHFGLSSKDMIATLETTARTDADPDVRTMAAAQLYGVNEFEPRRRAEILSAMNTLWQETKGQKGEFARRAVEILRREMQTPLPENAMAADFVRERRVNAALSLALITPEMDVATQRSINRTLAESYSNTYPVLAVKIIDAMVPDRIRQLTASDAQLANSFRSSVVDLTRTLPESKVRSESLEKILGKIEPLLSGGDAALRQQLCRNLESMLDNNQYNRNYAEFFPNLRAAAIDTLAALGSRDSFDIIRRHATAEAKITVGSKQLDANEKDATVRMASIRALERLQDPEIRSYIATLIDKETDPQVASRLRDIRFFQQRLEPSSREYQDIRQRVEASVINPAAEAKYPHIGAFGQERAQNWLKENFPLLDAVEFRRQAQNAIDDAAYGFPNLFRSTSTVLTMERDAAQGLQNQRCEQWRNLAAMARQENADGDYARRALYYIATSPVADFLGPGGQAVGLHSDYDNNHQFTGFMHYNWRKDAAASLAAACGTGTGSRDMTAHYIEQGLTATSGLSAESRIAMLAGLKELAVPNRAGEAGITREKLAQTLTRALELELRRPSADQSEQFQAALVRELKEMKYRMAVPVFDGMARSRFQSVKDAANEALVELRDSVSLMWDQTVADQNGTPPQRAERVRLALADTNNGERTVQEIFSAYKGSRISDAKDPGLAQLQVAMQDTNERVRLAAARVLIDSQLPNNNPTKAKAIQVLADLVMTSSTAGYRTDAFAELSKLDLPAPLHLMGAGNRLLKLEKVAGKIRGTEFEGNKETGWIYQSGGAMRVQVDANNNLTGFTENGKTYRRKQDGGRFIDQWDGPNNSIWKGRYNLLANGSYSFQQEGVAKRWTRAADGSWSEAAVPRTP